MARVIHARMTGETTRLPDWSIGFNAALNTIQYLLRINYADNETAHEIHEFIGWHYISHMLQPGDPLADCHAVARLELANRTGAGFVGII